MAVGGKVYHVDPDYPDITLSPGVKYLFKYVIYYPYDQVAADVIATPDDLVFKLPKLDKLITVPSFTKICGYSHVETPFAPEWTYSSQVVFCITVDSQVKVTAKTIGVALKKAIEKLFSHVFDHSHFSPPSRDKITVVPVLFVDGATDTTQQSLDLISGARVPAAGWGADVQKFIDLFHFHIPTEVVMAVAIGIAVGIVLNLFKGR